MHNNFSAPIGACIALLLISSSYASVAVTRNRGVSPAAVASNNLVRNASLEDLNGSFVNTDCNYMSLVAGSTVIPDWTVTATTIREIVWGHFPTCDAQTPADGRFFVDLSGFGSDSTNGGLEQMLTGLVVGRVYIFSVDIVNAIPAVTVGAKTLTLKPGIPFRRGTDTWVPQNGGFVAQSTDMLLTIRNATPGTQISFIDNIGVRPQRAD